MNESEVTVPYEYVYCVRWDRVSDDGRKTACSWQAPAKSELYLVRVGFRFVSALSQGWTSGEGEQAPLRKHQDCCCAIWFGLYVNPCSSDKLLGCLATKCISTLLVHPLNLCGRFSRLPWKRGASQRFCCTQVEPVRARLENVRTVCSGRVRCPR